MKAFITNTSPRQAALIAGISFFISVLIVTLVDDFLLANFVIPGNSDTLARDIEEGFQLFIFAAIGYLVVLVLDSVIGVALFIVLLPANRILALLAGGLRLFYAAALVFGVLALLFQLINAHDYASIKLLGYIFFALHIFILGCAVLNSGYIPRIIGIFLIVASLAYVTFFVDFQMNAAFSVLIMLVMAGAEIVLCVWLIAKRNSLPLKGGLRIGEAA